MIVVVADGQCYNGPHFTMNTALQLAESGASDLARTLDLVLDQLASVVAHSSSAILLLEGSRLDMVAARGYPPPQPVLPQSFRLDDSPLLTALLQRTAPVVFSGHLADEVFYEVACYGPGCHCVN